MNNQWQISQIAAPSSGRYPSKDSPIAKDAIDYDTIKELSIFGGKS
jgi:hypothetical protein